ncbi:hypothetical protein, partial [Janibacter hoylei]|uniref:hypothetical protein n=1 Tax=Janibacter hoylei TaxID=364298 RepID=UPI0024924C31
TPHTSGDLTTVEVPPGATADGFGIRYQGHLFITEPGNYQVQQNFDGYKTQETWAGYHFDPVFSDSAAVNRFFYEPLYLTYGAHAFSI